MEAIRSISEVKEYRPLEAERWAAENYDENTVLSQARHANEAK